MSLVALHMFFVVVVVLPLVGNLWGDEEVGEWVRIGVQFKAIQHQLVGPVGSVDGEVELEVAAVLLVVFGLSVVVLEYGGASGAVEAQRLGLRKGCALERESLDDLNVVRGDAGGE